MTRSEILDAAKKIVNGERQKQYGNPEDNFKVISEFWSIYLGYPVTPEDVAVMMILFKIGRIETGTGTNDCWVDIASYCACGGEIATTEKEKEEGVKIHA